MYDSSQGAAKWYPGGEVLPVRALLAAMNCPKGDVDGNLRRHEAQLRSAAEQGCRLVVFPEMSLTGSIDPRTPGAGLGLEAPAVAALASATGRHGVGAVFGMAERGAQGGVHITQVFAHRGRIVGTYRKRHLGEGEEGFVAGGERALFEIAGVSFGITICAESGVDYPFDDAVALGARFICFCAAPGLYGRRTDGASWRRGWDWWCGHGLREVAAHARRLSIWVAVATQSGSTVDEDFPGLAALVGPDGSVAAATPDWREAVLPVDVPLGG